MIDVCFLPRIFIERFLNLECGERSKVGDNCHRFSSFGGWVGGSWTRTTAERFSKTVIWTVSPEKASLKPVSLTSVLTLL